MRMKKAMIAAIAMAMMLMLCGCPADTEDEALNGENAVNIAVVNGYRSNNPTPPFRSQTVTDAILNSAISYGNITVIVADGTPFAAASFAINPPNRNLSATKRMDIANEQTQQVVQTISKAKARSEEVDVLAAISLAARSLADADGRKSILVLDNGLSTTGYMDFTKNLLRVADAKTVVAYLEETHALPDLSGMEVLWVGLGDTCGDQQPLNPKSREMLKAIWNDTLYAAGAEEVTFSNDLPGAAPADENELPFVTPILICGDDALVIEADDEAPLFDEPYVLDEGKVLFLPDSAVLADMAKALDTLRPLAEGLSSHPEVKVVLAGTTASAGTAEACERLSLERAGTVKGVLLELGVQAEQIAATYGLGYENAFHIPDLNADGTLNENAQANRAVVVLNADSQYMTLLEKNG